jgi:ribosome-binding protein aMBF1 (putative translation factor)
MSKAHRGTGIRQEPKHGRGKCARCGKENIKVLYEKEIDGAQVKVCKFCNAALKNIARVEARKAKPAEAEAPAAEAAPTEEAQA